MTNSTTDDLFKSRNGIVAAIKALSGQSRQMVISRPLIDMCGGIFHALLFNQILYWSDVTKDPDGWFPHSYEEWETETTLSKYHVMQAMKTLSQMGIETDVRRSPHHKFAPIVHYRVNDEILGEFVQGFFMSRSSKDLTNESEKSKRSNRKISALSKSEKPKQINTEMITQTQKEKESSALLPIDDASSLSPIGDSVPGDELTEQGQVLIESAFAVKAENDTSLFPTDVKQPVEGLPPAAAPEPDPKPNPRERNALQEAMAYAFKEGYGGLAGRIGGFFSATLKDESKHRAWYLVQPTEQPATPQEVVALALWYSRNPDYAETYAKKSGLPKTPSVLRERLDEFRGSVGYAKSMELAGPIMDRLMKGEKLRPTSSDIKTTAAAPARASAQTYKAIQPTQPTDRREEGYEALAAETFGV